MISAVSLRLLYLIFQHMLGLLLLMARTSNTKDIELLVLARGWSFAARGVGADMASPSTPVAGTPFFKIDHAS